MNIKKLINQSDLDNLEELSKRWNRVQDQSNRTLAQSYNPTSQNHKIKEKQNIATKQNIINTANSKTKQSSRDDLIQTDYKKLLEKKNHSHTPHVIDQDTEHFKIRLQHLLNVFKTDAVSQFMSMKRSMLDDQKDQVRADTQKYLRMYQQKHSQLILARENLISKTRECQVKGNRCQQMAIMIAKQKQKNRILKYLATPFSNLFKYKQYKKQKKIKIQQASKANAKRLIKKAMGSWNKFHRQQNNLIRKQNQQKKLQYEITEITGKYQKQIQMLRQKLEQATAKVQQFERNKTTMQQNLKKAFMRGICAMNYEAMSTLQGNPGQQIMSDLQQQKVQQILMNNTSVSFGKKQQKSKSNIVYFNQPKIQSKDHKWRQAPITQIQQRQCEDIQPITVIPEAATQDEGKVIKIINGKSTTIVNNSQMKSNNMQGKKIIGVATNNNQRVINNAQLGSTRKR